MPTREEILEAQVKLLAEAHQEANDALRSAWQVAERDGERTDWATFRAVLRHSLDVSFAAMDALRTFEKGTTP